ncbi:MAG: peptide ABC transporter substrate-binding protein [Candidatus Eremiobacteraeota bacterium]|nr:peptide ABC transporter substrate-binding protein [Candidatus Eremiobacteraeota bacterium]
MLVVAALAAIFSGCTQQSNTTSTTSNGSSAPNTGTKPGVLRIAIQQDVKNLNPLLASNTTDGMISRLMFEPLVSGDDKGNPVPMLATVVPDTTNGGIGKDGLTVTYHLRKDVKWSDGVGFTSKDVKFSWQAVMNPNNNIISRHGYDMISGIDTPDDYTAVIHLKQKFAPFVNTFFAESDQPMPVVPSHILSSYPNLNQIPFNTAPTVGDGPFVFSKWAHGDRIELAANPHFFMGKPKLDKVILRVIPDENTSVNLLRTHDVDWMFQASTNTYPRVKDIAGTHLYFVNVNGYEDVQLNVQRPLLQDVRVRQAVAYATDKQRLIDTLTFGTQKAAIEDQPNVFGWYDPTVKDYPHDLVKAKQLLAQAGWSPGPDGIMQKGGKKLALQLVSNNSNVTRRQGTVQFQAMMKSAGIEVDVKYYPGDILFAPVGEGGILQGGKFDLSWAGWYAGVDPDDSSQLTCVNVAPKGYNYSRYCVPKMESAQKAALETYDAGARKKPYSDIQHLLHADVPEIYFWYIRQMQPISNDFKGFDPNPVTESWNAWQWSI